MIAIAECKSTEILLEPGRDQFFSDLYERIFPAVARLIRKQHGTLDDARDVFHDALIIFYEKKLSGALAVDLTDDAYVFGIVKHLWLKRSKLNKNIVLDEAELLIRVEDDIQSHPDTNAILEYLKATGEKCMALLQAFYYDRKSLDKIRTVFGFSSARSATVQKFKCLEKVREVIKNKSKRYEDFFE